MLLALLAGCKKRYDGTCQVAADCLDFQKCSSGICVRAKAIFDPYIPPAVPPPAPIVKKAKPSAFPPLPELQEPATKPAAPERPKLGPAVPHPRQHRDPQQARKFRLDA